MTKRYARLAIICLGLLSGCRAGWHDHVASMPVGEDEKVCTLGPVKPAESVVWPLLM
ncbi:hypothetical protein QWY20_11925 [Alkalimonas sp. MEB108]|uniref:Lipoprotein n=1 Tax=Alkalimonas cellulosilytica TaxID=3058395 RepID=A0ABU7J6K6_9GAMM|nr:hypothetical protein [Alkalimonas sp. MEB108]MEE2002161.1 hypothetical protein [Alkalimonas sp. MEB108]